MTRLLLTSALAADPQLWSVTGVAPNDTLTVRKKPGASSEAVGTLPPDTRGIAEIEQDGEGWVKVRAGTLEGWVNGAFLTPTAPPSGWLPTALTCGGTEPFWSIQMDGSSSKVISPDRPTAPELPFSQAKATHGAAWMVTPRGKGAGYSWLTVSLAPNQCSDGMSNTRYGWSALALTAEHGFVAGCCRVAG
jgi:uncharacterized membrane protein